MTPRLVAAAAAILVLSAALIAMTTYARHLAERDVHAVAPQMFAQKNQGVALQRAAFRQPDLLPLYGSSELNVRSPYHASALFRSYPTGFTVFPVGSAGSTSLIWLQALAAVGPDLHGRQVAVSISPRSFMNDAVDAHAYAVNFSPLQAAELAFSPRISFAVKQGAARRMLAYPATLVGDPLLRFALLQLADGSLTSRVFYYASLPLGYLHTLLLRIHDDWETLRFLHAQRGLAPAMRQRADLDWPRILRQAEAEVRRDDDGNPFGFSSEFWTSHAPEIAMQKGLYRAEVVDRSLQESAEWTALDLLLQAIRDLGGEPLILSLPMKGAYDDYLGIPFSTRAAYYDRLQKLAQADTARVVDFAEHDSDTSFTIDPGLHLSSEGWTYYDRALDAFFHGQQPNEM